MKNITNNIPQIKLLNRHYIMLDNVQPNFNISPYINQNFHLLQPDKDSKHDLDIHQKNDIDDENDPKNFLYCKKCKYKITANSERMIINNKHEHIFTNPNGYIFQIGCFIRAQGCAMSEDESDYFSWFQGYTWRIAMCMQCLTLMGWYFSSNKSQFFGIILDKLSFKHN